MRLGSSPTPIYPIFIAFTPFPMAARAAMGSLSFRLWGKGPLQRPLESKAPAATGNARAASERLLLEVSENLCRSIKRELGYVRVLEVRVEVSLVDTEIPAHLRYADAGLFLQPLIGCKAASLRGIDVLGLVTSRSPR